MAWLWVVIAISGYYFIGSITYRVAVKWNEDLPQYKRRDTEQNVFLAVVWPFVIATLITAIILFGIIEYGFKPLYSVTSKATNGLADWIARIL